MNARALRVRFSKSLANRRHRLSQAKVRSTTQRLGKNLEALRGIRTFDPTFLPLRIRQPECPRKLRASTAALDLWC